jgi:hypothetical protein
MAKFTTPTKKQRALWVKWINERPQVIRDAVAQYKLDPWTLYKLKTTGQRVTLASISEPNPTVNPLIQKCTVRVGITGEFNLVTHERDVFGIDPADLEECDLPAADEQLGSLDLPHDLIKNLMEKFPGGPPPLVMFNLIFEYPLRKTKR